MTTVRPPPVDLDKGLVDKGEDKSPLRATPLLVPEDSANLLGYVKTPANTKLAGVYMVIIHNNNWTHMEGGVRDDAAW